MDRGRAPNGIGHLMILLIFHKPKRCSLIAVAEGDRLSGIRRDPE